MAHSSVLTIEGTHRWCNCSGISTFECLLIILNSDSAVFIPFSRVNELRVVASVSTKHRFAEDMNFVKKFTPHHGSPLTFESTNFHQATSTMSASSERYEDSVQILENVLDTGLLERAAAGLHAGSRTAPDAVTTTLDWTSACEELLAYFREQVHPKVFLKEGNDKEHCADAIPRPSRNPRSLNSSKRLRSQSPLSKWLSALIQPLRNSSPAESGLPLIIIRSSLSLSKDYRHG